MPGRLGRGCRVGWAGDAGSAGPGMPGRLRRECGALRRCSPGVAVGIVVAVVALVVATGFGLWWRARDGRLRERPGAGAAAHQSVQRAAASQELTSADIGAQLGDRATLVQFSSAFCAPCRATRGVLSEVAKMVDGVRHVEIDAESRLDLVRRLDVMRTPTTFVLGPGGHITHRASGQPRKADVIAALGAMIEFPI
jgi:thiol-disulfide isomerase/thioredoxin